MPFVAQYLKNPEPMLVEGAALALGESRTRQALKLLQDLWEDTLDQELKKLLLLPMARNDTLVTEVYIREFTSTG